MREALREALANALIHSDYYERRGLVVEKRKDEIIILNPGALRIPKDEALAGGISDPRNAVLFSMFAQIGIGERAGSGLANIKSVWAENKLPEPRLSEQFNPDRTILSLPLVKNVGVNVGVKLTKTEQKLLELLKTNGGLTAAELADKLDVDSRTIERGLKKLRNDNVIERIGSDKTGEWKISASKE
jgi:predicted HTH transcriptional regulator